MNFGKWIVVAFVTFAIYIGTLVFICLKQDVSLVSKNYYQDELKYQEKINRITNTNYLTHRPTIAIENGLVRISFEGNPGIQKGELKIERPSNIKLDRNFRLTPGEANQEFSLGKWASGLYRTSVTWTMEDKDYYFEKQIVL